MSTGGATTKRESNKRDKQRRIRESAWALFRELGFDGTTTKAIAERAGIAAGTLFLYAKTKEEILFLLFRDELAEILRERAAETRTGADLVEKLVYLFRGFYERYAEDRDLAARFVKLIFTLGEASRGSMRELDVELVKQVATAFETEKRNGLIADHVSARLFAANVFALYGFHVLDFLAHPERSLDEGISTLARSLRMLVDGCRT